MKQETINLIIQYTALMLIPPVMYFISSQIGNPILYGLCIVVVIMIMCTKSILDEIKKLKE
jgi:hypothetical protein